MIIFFEKKTGQIVGTIDGRIHTNEHLKMWIGDKKEVDRLIVGWEPVEKGSKVVEKNVLLGYKKNKEGFNEAVIGRIKQKVKIVEYEPKTSQKKLFLDIERGEKKIFDYKIDLKTKNLIKK